MHAAPRGAKRTASSVLFATLTLLSASVTAQAPGATPTEDAPRTDAPASTPEPPSERSPTGLDGRVVDSFTGSPLPDALVLATGPRRARTTTDENGEFHLDLAPGTYVVRAFAEFYDPARIRNVRVRRNRRGSTTVRMRPQEEAIQEIEIVEVGSGGTVAAQLAARRESAASRDAVSGEDIRRTGDSSAGAAARRVVGTSVEGRYLVVRGLGDRYTAVTMNGMQLPGTDPDRAGVQLDVIPTSIVSSLAIAKTFTPDQMASWAGGLMMIDSVQYPDRFTLSLSASVGANSRATFREVPHGQTQTFDWLGFGMRGRRLPNDFPEVRFQPSSDLTQDQIREHIARTQSPWQYRMQREAPNVNVGVNVGNTWNLRGDRRLGMTLVATYNRAAQLREGQYIQVANIPPGSDFSSYIRNVSFRTTTSSEETLFTLFGTSSLRYSPNGDLRVLAMLTQSGLSETRLQRGEDVESNLDVDQWQINFTQRQVLYAQLTGEQRNLGRFRDSRLRWGLAASRSSRDTPELLQFGRAHDLSQPGEHVWMERPNAADRFVMALDQRDVSGLANVRIGLGERGALTIGGEGRFTSREFASRQIHYSLANGYVQSVHGTLSPEELFLPENYGPQNLFRTREMTRAADGYRGEQLWLAAFGMLELEPHERLRLVGGVRAESMRQFIESVSPVLVDPRTGERAYSMNVDWLPSFTAVLDLTDQMALRTSYGMTVGRPQFRELAPFVFYEFERRRSVAGRPDLNRTLVHNADVRWEWFPSETEVLAASLFYKRFVHPIERQITAVGSNDVTFRNEAGAYSYGVELEARFSFEHLHEYLRFFSLNGNAAILESRVDLSEKSRESAFNPRRRMYYQAPYVANLSLRFDHPATGLGLGFVYNVVGPRISDVGYRDNTGSVPDVEEQTFHSLDFVGSWRRPEGHWQLRWSVRNILNDDRVWKAGPILIERWRPGLDFNVGASYSY